MISSELSAELEAVKKNSTELLGSDVAGHFEGRLSDSDLIETIDVFTHMASELIREDERGKTNFEIEIKDGKKGREIWLKNQDGRVRNLAEDLPTDFRVEAGEDFMQKRKVIRIAEDDIKKPSFLLSYAHERAHAIDGMNHKFWNNERLILGLKQAIKLIQSFRPSTELKVEGDVKTRVFKLKVDEKFYESKLFDKIDEITSEEEKMAWGGAISYLQQLERDGYEVFNGFSNDPLERENRIGAYMGLCMLTYDLAHVRRLLKLAQKKGENV